MGNTFGTRDSKLLFGTVFIRMFSFGWIAVILFLYLISIGYTQLQIGTLLTFTLIGDLLITLYLTTHATRLGRRTTLMLGAAGKIIAGAAFVFGSEYYWILVAAGTVGVLTPTGGDIGPFKAVEQAALAELVSRAKSAESESELDPESAPAPDEARRAVLAGLNWMTGYYALVSAWAQGLGALASGFFVTNLQAGSIAAFGTFTAAESYRVVCLGYTVFGVLMLALFAMLSDAVEPEVCAVPRVRTGMPVFDSILTRSLAGAVRPCVVIDRSHQPVKVDYASSKSMWSSLFGLHSPSTRRTVFKLSALFTLDAFAGGFVMQTFITFWFYTRYGLEEKWLGSLLLGANFLAGLSAMAAVPLGIRIGEINTMVFTHLPSNVLLILVVLMPNVEWAVAMLLLRFSISQMDVPARNAYVNGVVDKNERDAANGITNLIRSLGVSLSPLGLAYLIDDPTNHWRFGLPFIISGGLKIVYDVLVYFIFNDYCCVSERVAQPARATAATGMRSGSKTAYAPVPSAEAARA